MRRFLVVLAVLALVAAGCGRSTETETENEGGSPPVALSGEVNDHGTRDVSSAGATVQLDLEADDFSFEPTFVKAAPGAMVTFVVRNEGQVPHTFTIDAPSVDLEVPSGERKTVELTLPSTGVVNFYCRFHRSQGMQGAFFFDAGRADEGSERSY